jgi:hypothetical protein
LSRTTRPGDARVSPVPGLKLHVAFNDRWNIGLTSDWIIHADQHDPFDFHGAGPTLHGCRINWLRSGWCSMLVRPLLSIGVRARDF